MTHSIIHYIQKFPLFIVAATIVLAGMAIWYGSNVSNSLKGGGFAAPQSESTHVTDTLQQDFREAQADLLIVLSAKDTLITNTKPAAEIQRQTDWLKNNDDVRKVETYFTSGVEKLLSKDKSKAMMLVSLDGSPEEQAKTAGKIRDSMNSSLGITMGGVALVNYDITHQIGRDLIQAEMISFIALAILLVIVFRGIVAAIIPLLLGGLTIVGAFAVLQLLANMTTIVEYALNAIILIGLGLAIDYSLLIVSRFREELYATTNNVTQALTTTYRTAGRTVFFSGLTVIISLASLTIFPLDFLRSIGFGGAAAVSIAMVAALIVLPAVLRLLGTRINWLSFGSARRMSKAATSGATFTTGKSICYRTGAFFMQHAGVTLTVSLVILFVATLPLSRIQLASPDERVLPVTTSSREASWVVEKDFGIDLKPIRIIYTAPSLDDEQQIGALYDYTRKLETLAGVKDVESVVHLSPSLDKRAYQQLLKRPDAVPGQLQDQIKKLTRDRQTVITITNSSDASSSEARQLVSAIRALELPPGVSVHTGGFTAELVDQLAVLKHYFPYALLLIGVTLFVLLFLMLGSLVIPLKAIIQNILSLGAAFGMMVLIFQDGVIDWLLPINHTDFIYATLPAMIFATAFGLSMDYSVFLYSRIKEQYDKTGDNSQAVLLGLQKTGSIITSAACLLVVVVIAFAVSGISIMQQIGVGLTLAILLDAFVVRMILVPATMRLLGRYNWWAPQPLVRLQRKLGWGERE